MLVLAQKRLYLSRNARISYDSNRSFFHIFYNLDGSSARVTSFQLSTLNIFYSITLNRKKKHKKFSGIFRVWRETRGHMTEYVSSSFSLARHVFFK